jgi:AraC-like DNA-binding protein
MASNYKKDGFPGQKQCIIPFHLRELARQDPLCKWIYITDIGFYPKAQYHSRERKRGSDEHILMYCVAGKGVCYIDQKLYVVTANQLLVFPSGVPHRYKADKTNPWTIYWIHFTGINAGELSTYLLGKDFTKPIDVVFSDERNSLFDKIFSLSEVVANMESYSNLSLSFPYYLVSFKESSSSRESADPKYDPVEKSVAFMKANLSSTFTLKNLADQVSLSPSHYCAVFQKKMQNSPVSYFIYLKMQYACNMLANSGNSIKSIAIELGYTDAFYFSRTFKNVMGVSPQNFRKRY